MTHIPIPDLARKSGMSDKTMHFLSYMGLVFLVWFSSSPYHKVNWKKPKVWMVLTIVIWYGVIDEFLQGFMGRSADAADFLADLTGALVCLGILSLLSFWPATLTVTIIFIFIISNFSGIDVLSTYPHLNSGFHFIGYALLTLVWIQLCGRAIFKDRRSNGIKRLLYSFILPSGFLALVKLTGVYMFNKMFWIYDIYTALAGILLMIFISWIVYSLDMSDKLKEIKEQL